MKKSISFSFWLVSLSLTLSVSVQAQQDPQFTQYMFNGMFLNPAYAGSKGFSSFSGSIRNQWAGFEGAPTTQTASFDGNLTSKLGTGFTIVNDKLGAQRFTEVSASLAARVSLSKSTRLAAGISLGAVQQALDRNLLDPDEPDDQAMLNGADRVLKPTAKVGLYLNSDRFFTGVSVGNLVFFKKGMPVAPDPHLYVTAGGLLDLNRHLKFKPSFLWKEDFKGPSSLDLNAFMLFYDRFWLGASYRTTINALKSREYSPDTRLSNALAGAVQVYASPRLRFGYSYDFTFNGFPSYSTHELSIGYYLLKKAYGRMLTPRYF